MKNRYYHVNINALCILKCIQNGANYDFSFVLRTIAPAFSNKESRIYDYALRSCFKFPSSADIQQQSSTQLIETCKCTPHGLAVIHNKAAEDSSND